MDEQETIRYENMLTIANGSEYRKYEYLSVGMVVHFLYVYGLPSYDSATIGNKYVELYGKRVVEEYHWDEKRQIPVFIFMPDYYPLSKAQDIYLKGLDELNAGNGKGQYVVLEHLLLPNRGFRFWTTNHADCALLMDRTKAYEPVFYTDSVDEAIAESQKTNSRAVPTHSELMKFWMDNPNETP